jgi:hypothetical protein
MNSAGLILLLTAAVLAGCTSETSQIIPTSEVSSDDNAHVVTVSRSLSGQVLYRIANDEPPLAAHSGDSPTFCFLMPSHSRHFRANLSWDPPQPFFLQFNEGASDSPAATASGTLPPLEITISEPREGEWFGYAGPSSVGGGVAWQLDLEWQVTGATEIEDTIYQGDPCY